MIRTSTKAARAALLLALLAPVAATPLHAQVAGAARSTMTIADVRRLVRVADPQLSPDGRTALVVVSRPDYAANVFRAELVAVDVRSGAQSVLVRGRAGLGNARWSPAGDRIAFLADSGGRRQLHVVARAGGDPTALTRVPTGVQSFAWRPDGRALAFVAADVRPTRPDSLRFDDAFEVANDHYTTTASPMPSHLWLVPAAGGTPVRLTSGAWSLSTSLGGSPVSWAPDGRAIAFVRLASASPGDTDMGTVMLIDVDSAGTSVTAPRALTGRASREAAVLWSPDGARLAYTWPKEGDPANLDHVMVSPRDGGPGEAVTAALDRHVTDIADWSADGRSLLVGGTDGTRSALWWQPIGGAARRVALGDLVTVSGTSVAANGTLALVGTQAMRPAELYVMASPTSAPRRLTNFNADVASLALGRSERLTWRARDGLLVDGVLTYPPGYDASRRHPLVVFIHGGPTASSTEGFSAMSQLLAARGWIVLQPNYRGSDNLGNAFQRAIARDAAEGPGEDIVAAVDALVARGVVDSARVAVSGWSYGGFMTAWLIGRYPGRWRAAVAGAAPVDLTDMYALTDLNVMRRHAITESPFTGDNLPKYMAMSPIVHLPKARTPTLVMSTTGDVRVVVTGSYKIYHALKDNGVPVQFVAFPGGGHSPADPVRALERDRRWVEWIARWMDETPRAARLDQ
jgi:dipeptidyl aminopeptidase/acylaminoacyl peptidase